VTVTGFVRSHTQRWQAEGNVKRVSGVVGIANDIEVRLPTSSHRPDPEIARDAVAALKRELPFSSETMRVLEYRGMHVMDNLGSHKGAI
jgi:hypothetical protein